MRKILLIILIVVLLLPSFTFARSLSIDNYSIDYVINTDGQVNVSEKLTYTLEGCYTELYLQKPTSLQILNASGSCDGKECFFRHDQKDTPSGDQELVLKSNYCDETINVSFSYDIVNVINQLQDGIFQFYYQLYGKETDYSTNLNISLTIPNSFDNTEYFLHSKNYNLDIVNNKMLFSKKVLPKEPVEINLLMPSNYLIKSDKIKLDSTTSNNVKNLEKDWENEYDEYIKSTTPLSTFNQIIIIFLYLLIPFIVFFLIWKKYSKEFSREEVSFFEEYYRELPDNKDPLFANYFVNEKFSQNWFSSGIMYLVWKEKYLLDKEDESYFLTRTEKEISLPEYVSKIDQFIFKYFKNEKFNVLDISKSLKGHNVLNGNIIDNYKRSTQMLNDFRKMATEIEKDYDTKFYKNKEIYNRKGKKFASIFSGFYLIGIFIYTMIIINRMPLLFIFLMLVFVATLFLINSRIFGRFTKEGRIINLKWNGFKKYITDFSDIKNHPPKHVILWEEYLVYATSFGIARTVLKNIKSLNLESFNNNSRLGVYSSFIVSNSFSNLNTLSSTSSSGSGGGFGGGGGGGGAGGR